MATVSMVGAGYVGLVTGACLAELGHMVTCIEIDQHRLGSLQRGVIPIFEPDLEELCRRNRAAGRLRFTEDYAGAMAEADFAFIAVNTPTAVDGGADTDAVFAAVRSLLPHARPGLVIVMKSTVPAGTGDAVAALAVAEGVNAVEVVSNPEFLREGTAVADFFQPDRIVIGAEQSEAGAALAGLYARLEAPVIFCSRRSAELAKYAANALLATRISFINEVASICGAVGADIEEVARIVGADSRIGPSFLSAGLGWGGSCFPKDVLALATIARSEGQSSSILDAVYSVNRAQRQHAVDMVLTAVAGVDNPTVGVLGLAFKPDTDDIREAPAIDIIGRLVEEGIHVRAHDPVAMPNARAALPQIKYCADAYEAARGVDALLLATEWPDYLALDWDRIAAAMSGRTVVDGRNVLSEEQLRHAGLEYLSFGRARAGHPPGIAQENGRRPAASRRNR